MKVLARHSISGRVEPIEERYIDHPVLGEYLTRTEVDKPLILSRKLSGPEAKKRAAEKKAEEQEKLAAEKQPTPNDVPAHTDSKDDK